MDKLTLQRGVLAGIVLASCLSLFGCAGSQILERSGDQPGWARDSRESFTQERNGEKRVYLRATIDRARDLSLAKREGRYELAKAIAGQVSEEIEALFQSAKVGAGNSIDRADTTGSKIRDAVTAQASARISSLSIDETYWERRLFKTETGEVEGYRVYVLGSIPEQELKELKVAGYRRAQELARASGDREAESLLDDQLVRMRSSK
ncbi:hypothetical protein D3C87_1194390 [compost metagenome]